jgi:hypothetical protein
MKVNRWFICGLLAASGPLCADMELYKEGDTNLDLKAIVNAATFMGNDSSFGESKSFYGANTDDWSEGTFELGLAGATAIGRGSVFAEVSGLYTRTWGNDASGLTVDENNTDDTDWEQAHIGWRSGSTFSALDEDAVSVQAGKFDYVVGTGLLIADGTSDGGERGGWYLSSRKVFHDSFLAKLDTGPWLVEGFYLENEARRGGGEGEAWGTNIEYEIEASNMLLGTSWFRIPDEDKFEFEGYDALSLRGDWKLTPEFTLSGEFVTEDKKQGADPQGWFVQGTYQLNDVSWTPEFCSRYSAFDGDDRSTAKDEGFSVAAYGFTDYGSWFQGEVTGNYPLDNSNQLSHMVRMQVFPTEDLILNLQYYNFTLDEKHIFGDPVSSDDWGDEINLTADWELNDNIYLIGVLAVLFPGDAAEDWTGGDENWTYGMLMMTYTF